MTTRLSKPKVIDRYIFVELLQFFGITLAAFVCVLLTLRMLKFAALIINKGVEVSQIVSLFTAIIPPFLEIAIPLATLLGVMLAFSRLSGDSEIIIMRASGIGIMRLALPVLVFGAVALATNAAISIYLRPWSFHHLSQVLFDIARSRTTSGLSPGIFNKLQDITLYAEEIDSKAGTLKNILIDDRRNPAQRKVFIAHRGGISSNSELETITFSLAQGTIHEALGEKYSVTSFNSNSLVFEPNELLDKNSDKKGKRTEEMSITDLRILAQQLGAVLGKAESGETDFGPQPEPGKVVLDTGEMVPNKEVKKKINRINLEVARRLSLPFAPLALALIGLPLGIHSPRTQRTWGIHLSVAFGLGVFVIYYGILSLGMALGESGSVSPWVALWAPNLVTAGLGYYLLRHIAAERWQSMSDAFAPLVSRVQRVVRRTK